MNESILIKKNWSSFTHSILNIVHTSCKILEIPDNRYMYWDLLLISTILFVQVWICTIMLVFFFWGGGCHIIIRSFLRSSLVFPVMRMNSIPPLFSALSVAPTYVWSAQNKLTQREHSPNTSEYQSQKNPRRTQSALSIRCIWSSLLVLRRSVRTRLWCVTSVRTTEGMSNTG